MNKDTDVILISMPFGPIGEPSMGLSLLKAGLARAGIVSRIYYFNLRFAELIGQGLYKLIGEATASSNLIGEWVFSQSLFGLKPKIELSEYADQILRLHGVDLSREDPFGLPLDDHVIERIIGSIDFVEPFLLDCIEDVALREPVVVGFTNVFQQQVASLSLAKRIKERMPATQV